VRLVTDGDTGDTDSSVRTALEACNSNEGILIMRNTARHLLAASLAAVLLTPGAGLAREESKIRLFMEKLGGGNEKGMLRSQLAPGSASLRLHVNHLVPNLEHIVMGDGVEVDRFTTNGAGNAEVRIDLFATGGGTTPTFDPRGKFLTINDGTNDVLAAWVYADPAADPPRPQIKETTALARDALVMQGAVDARYEALPSGSARLLIALRGVVPGDYEVFVDGASIATVTTNPAGHASVDLRVQPGQGGMSGNAGGNGNGNGNGKGKGNANKHKGALTMNPRSKLIEVKQASAVHFSGSMLAQIPGLGVCAASSASANLALDPAQTAGSGSVMLDVEASCDLQLTVSVAGLAAGDYDLVIAGAPAAVITVPVGGAATVVYDETPEAGELPLPAGVASAASVAIVQKPPLGTATVLTGELP